MQIRELTVDDIDAVYDNRRRAFGPLSEGDAETWRELVLPALAAGRYLGVVDGSRLVATSRINDLTQWWHGRPISMGGVASVTVAPEDRGRGVGRMIMSAVLDRCAELGHPVSALYPATTHLYRSLGWEHAGAMHRITLRAEALRTIRSTERVEVRRMGPGDAAEVIAIIGRIHGASRASGPVCWDEEAWRLWLADEKDFLYLADDGFVVYRWDDGDIEVETLMAGSEATARALWSMVGSSSSIAESVHAIVAPDDPVLWLIGERSKEQVKQTRWMLRVVDLPAAVAGRGFPAGVALDAVVRVDDPQRPGNSGLWHLSAADGTGAAKPAEGYPGDVPVLTAGGLSALYAGVPVATLRLTGLLSGPADADEALGAAFHARPYMLDYF
ncbi:putative acetyltransferase [Streptosporangium becharense]|uniref:Putative acetyltransferase n=1 Tax=Streptosporangium becharense TaxID=1816182 RepID=A0A7W9ID62_9ACTN|nr:GNAT family N-acetyltransferase [Streptosporangium becharense]MBB2915000.1 putative acetyltransferase [Streptosporangium becharense]MBB5818049.1 putative acetyltransferase [Streptosporangium becharense]